MKARKGSTHGYDIVDHTKFNPELGGEAGFERLSAALQAARSRPDPRFRSQPCRRAFCRQSVVARRAGMGPASPHAASFDIDWEQLPYRARGGVLLPIIGSSYGEALENGEIELRYDAAEGSFSAWYFEHRLPIAPERYSEILRAIVKEAAAEDSAAGKRILDLASRYRGLRHPNRKRSARLQGRAESIAGAPRSSSAGLPPIAPGRTAPRRHWRCIICSNASTTGSAIGGWPPATSTIGASSTSIRWRDCGSRMPARSTPSTAWSEN